MKLLVALNRWVVKVEGVVLAASLVALLLLTLYSVAYRNLIGPVVLKMQVAGIEAQGTTPGAAPAVVAPAPAVVAPAPAAPAAPAAVKAKPAEGSFRGDLDDDGGAPPPAAAAPAAVKAKPAEGSFRGDLDDDGGAPPPAAAAPAAVKAKPAEGSFRGDLDDDGGAPPPAAAAAAAPAAAPAAAAAATATVPSAAPAGPEIAPTAPAESWTLQVLKALRFDWIDAVTRHLLLWVGFFGAAIAASRRGHIAIDALSRLLNPAWRARLRVFLDLLAAVVCAFLVRAAWHFILSESKGGGKLYGQIPSWVGIAIVPVGFALLSWQFAVQAVMGFMTAIGVKSPAIDEWRAEQDKYSREVAP